MARLKEEREKPPATESDIPIWGGLSIRIPEKPMQFEEQRRQAEHDAKDKNKQICRDLRREYLEYNPSVAEHTLGDHLLVQ